jgi:hypothetical protein
MAGTGKAVHGRRAASTLALGVALVLALPAVALSAPDRTVTVTGDTPASWTGPAQPAANQSTEGEPCGKSVTDYCDQTLVNVAVEGTLKVDVNGFSTPVDDFDLVVYKSDASGTRGDRVGSSGNVASQAESVSLPHASGYYLVRVVYYQTTGSYHGTATLTVTPPKPPIPVVTNPPGVPSSLASNLDLGFRSHSEPHIAQSPTNPNILIAGSKQYNRDTNSLPQYQFKIGTYASFDRGRTWTDLGQMNICPNASDAPPSSWPDNTCYPADDPNTAGNGPEDAKDPRPHTDFGEQYNVSDIWMGFDNEGNAYAMVLDNPGFADGAGWGMSFHKWKTPSPQDIASGNTWSRRIVINNYPQEKGNVGKGPNGTDNVDNRSNPLGGLDDKNTFAVNNAEPAGNGKTGIILACWGQNFRTLIKQQTVCKRSTDGGDSFPGPPVPVSGEQQLVLGVNVVADNRDPNTFYVMWKSYASAVAGGIIFGGVPGEHEDDLGTGIGSRPTVMYLSRTVDGGQTYSPAIPIAHYDELASPLHNTRVRTGAIPIGAQAPDGTLYYVFDAYNPAPQPGSSDGRNADIMLIRSTDGGNSWSTPVKVNQDKGNADQFQGHVAVAPDGEVSVTFFDRRHDPNNTYVDEYLARSDDKGRTWSETRLSHDMSDTSINPPISTSGEFFGDYQGAIADSCQSLAFYQDTHLANAADRVQGFDSGLPRSDFQQVFAYRAPKAGSAADPLCKAPEPASVGYAPFLNPGGRPGDTICGAVAPRSSISRGALKATRARLRVIGRASDLECVGQALHGRVARVDVAVSARVGKRCRFLLKSGRLSGARSCSKPVYLKAKLGRARSGKVPWSLRRKTALPVGAYTARARARDSRGNVEKRVRRYNRKGFRVR